MTSNERRRQGVRQSFHHAVRRATRDLQARAGRHRVGVVESLERRTLLAAGDPIISEFMADNTNGLVSGEGTRGDWIEIHNPGDAPIDLAGWHLTDTAANPTLYTFPSFVIPAGGYRVVFATNKVIPIVDSAGYPHTNFALGRDGEYLALSKPDGTVTTAFAPAYPPQSANVSYGYGPGGSGSAANLVTPGAPAKSVVPAGGAFGTDWTQAGFNDSSWTSVTSGIGFESGTSNVPPLTQESEGNNVQGDANDASTSFADYASDLFQLGFTGALGSAADSDFFNIGALQSGDVVTVTVSARGTFGALTDPLLEIYRAGAPATPVVSDDNSGPGNESLVYRFTVSSADTYYIRVRSAGTATGNYRVGVRLENSGAAPSTGGNTNAESEANETIATADPMSTSWRAVNYRSRIAGGTNFGSSHDWFKYQFTAGDVVTVFLDSTSNADGAVYLRDAAGNALASEDGTSTITASLEEARDSFVLSYVIPSTGTYYVDTVKSPGSPNGSYLYDVYLSTNTTPPRPAFFTGQYVSNVQAPMFGINATNYLRVPFSFGAGQQVTSLTLGMKYDDGFVAYLNGTEVARRNAPGTPGTPLAFNAAAASDRAAAQAITFENIDITAFAHLLSASGNVLAIQGLNSSASSPDFLLTPQLTSQLTTTATAQYFYTPTPGAQNIPGAGVVINEIHYDPDVKTQFVEFIELVNNSTQTVNISGWRFAGVTYTFPNNTTLAPGQYRVIAENAAAFQAKFGFAPFGTFTGSIANEGEEVRLRDAAGNTIDTVTYGAGFPWPTVGDPIGATGTGPSIQLLNPGLDNDLGGHWRSALPTPGAQNSVHTSNAPPAVRQVEHSPTQPVANQPVTITAKVTDPDGVGAVSLLYQVNAPGAYIPYQLVNPSSFAVTLNPAYNAGWVNVPMYDDGTHGDSVAGDGTYAAQIPPATNQNRTLVRYKITATDTFAASVTAPYTDDTQKNFAYYVYNGVPTWTGAVQPGSSSPASFGPTALNAAPVYTLITTKQDHADALHVPVGSVNPQGGGYGGEEYLWSGTFVYNGRVYDNIRWRARGGVWRYAMGKNMWKIDFNRNHYFDYVDAEGKQYPVQWKKLNLSAVVQQGNFGQRGEQGLFEYAGFKLFNLAGSPGPVSSPVHVRIVEDASEFGPTSSQYDDDFQGLYLAIEQEDGNLLEAHDLPDGNLYKMESGPGGGTSNNQGPTQPTNNSDLIAFTSAYKSGPQTEQWWRDNVDLDAYFAYRAVVDAIHHYDIGFGKNYFFYHNPDTNKWQQIPWDLDLTWTSTYAPGGGDTDPWKQGHGTPSSPNGILAIPAIAREYRNYLRGFRDLLWNPEQLGQLLDEYASLVNSGGPNSLVEADRRMWDYNPIVFSSYVNSGKAGAYHYYAGASGAPAVNTFAGMVAKLKSYVSSQASILNNLATEASVPNKPTIAYTGPAGFAVDALSFQSSDFSSPGNVSPFAAMRWRIAEVYDASNPFYAGKKFRPYEFQAAWTSPELTSFDPNVSIPASDLKPGRTYRVRVQMKDADGRWSNWSNPVQFVAGVPTAPVVNDLRVTEIMYNPAPPPAGSPYERGDFEYVEVLNRGGQTLDLTGVKFTSGFNFTFPDGYSLAPGQRALVVKNLAAFQSRYGNAFDSIIAGTISSGSIADEGESIRLEGPVGQTILDFSYSDSWYPQTDGEGFSLVIIDPDAAADTWDDKDSWRASRAADGDPGADAPNYAPNAVVVNEILANPAVAGQSWIELRNNTNAAVDISNWFLSDDPANPKKYQLPAGTVIPANGYLVLDEQSGYGLGATPFSPSRLGGTVYLSQGDAGGNLLGYRDSQAYGASAVGTTVGRYVKSTGKQDFTGLETPSTGLTNADPRVGPVVINEIMYHPTSGQTEYVELRNTTGDAIDISGWSFDGIAFTFPDGTVIPAYGYVLVLPVDPAAGPPVPPGTQVFGPFFGLLDDAGEEVSLLRPGAPAGPVTPMIVVDHVNYSSTDGWPAAPNGTGAVLRRVDPLAYGNDVINWASATTGTPGRPNVLTTATGALAPEHRDRINITFTEDVSASLATATAALTLENLSGGAVPSLTYSWNPATLTATWVFAQPIADGNYRVTLDGNAVQDWAGAFVDGNRDAAPGGAYTFDFYALAGDANGDRSVDFNDLVTLAQNYNSGGHTYDEGDFNGDGDVDFNDLVMLAQRYNTTLPANGAPVFDASAAPMPSLASVLKPAAPVAPTPAPTPTPTPTAPPPASRPAARPTGKPAAARAYAPAPQPTPVVAPVAAPVVMPTTTPAAVPVAMPAPVQQPEKESDDQAVVATLDPVTVAKPAARAATFSRARIR